MFVKPRNENLLVRLPTAACDETFRVTLKLLHYGQLLGSGLDLQNTVEACVANNGNVRNANGCQQFLAHLVLHIETGKASQHMSILPAIPAEEDLSGTEDAADTIDGNATMFQDVEIVVPELVLDEESHHRTNGTQEAAGVGDGV